MSTNHMDTRIHFPRSHTTYSQSVYDANQFSKHFQAQSLVFASILQVKFIGPPFTHLQGHVIQRQNGDCNASACLRAVAALELGYPKTLGSAVVAYHYLLKPFYNQSHRYCTLQNTVTYSNCSVPCMCKSCILIGTIVAVLEMAEVRTPSHTYVPIQNVSILTWVTIFRKVDGEIQAAQALGSKTTAHQIFSTSAQHLILTVHQLFEVLANVHELSISPWLRIYI